MASLNEKIIAYLTTNKIAFTADDYQTGQPEGQEDQVLIWNTEKLGIQPTQEQLDPTYETYQTNLELAEQEKINIKASAHAKLSALGLSAEEILAIGS
jgi:hypothetical protein